MTFSIFIGIASIVFLIGIVFIIKAVSSKGQEAVPISNPKEIEELKNAFLPSKDKDASVKETGSVATQPKEKRLFPRSKKQIEINQWMEENRRLKNEIIHQKDKFKQLEENLEVLKKEYHQIKEADSEKTKNLQSQIAKIKMEKEQLLINHKIIEDLKEKSELIEKKQQNNQIQQREMEAFIEQLESDKKQLLESQESGMDKAEFEALSNRLDGSIATIEQLKGENKNLQEINDELKANFKKTEEFNNHLLEKEKIVQYELTKNRAQNLGLEKICENFKIQIETMSSVESGKQQKQ